MTTNSRTSRRLAAGSLAAAAVAVLAAATPATGASHSDSDAVCSFDQTSLPRTADAMQGWYDQCYSQQPFSFYTTKAGLPAGDDMFVQRRTGDVVVTASYLTTSPSTNRPADWRALMNQVPEPTQAPTATRPVDWRALMNQVPETTQTPTATRPADWRALMNEVPEPTQPLGRPAPFAGVEYKGFRGLVESGAGHPAWTGSRSPMTDTEQSQARTVAAFDNGVGPGQELYDVVSG